MDYRVLVLIVCLLLPAVSEKRVGGIITRDTRWNAEDGPFYLTSDLLIARNVRLTLSPGTRVIVGAPSENDTAVIQYDHVDSHTVALKIHGTFTCVGKREKRITFGPDSSITGRPAWYGIVLYQADEQFTEIANTDITGAYCAVSPRQCSPLIRNCIIEHNHIGISCTDQAAARIYNCVIIFNDAAGIRIAEANPSIVNNIITANRNNGVWCDGISKISCTFNCISGNGDGDFLECDPELGITTGKNTNGDSIDIFDNIRSNPVFAGSSADSTAQRQDISLPTEKGLIHNPIIAAVIQHGKKAPPKTVAPLTGRYRCAKYSPCINAGDPSGTFKDSDGSRNDMGIWGGPEFSSK